MRLAEDEVGSVRLDDGHHGEFHGRPPEGDFKPPQAADFAPYHAATHVSASTQVSNTWTSITGDVGRDAWARRAASFRGIASKGIATCPRRRAGHHRGRLRP